MAPTADFSTLINPVEDSGGQSKDHHHVPKFMLRGFAGPDGRLTVVQVKPEPEVRRGRHPRKVGTVEHLNSWQHPDGSFDDELERIPLGRLDAIGGEGLHDLIDFARAVKPRGQLRLLDRHWEDRIPLTAHTAGLMVRSPKLRAVLDELALPTMIAHMRAGLLRQVEQGEAAEEDVKPLLLAFERPGMVELEPGRNRHQAVLVDLIISATAAVGAKHLVSVRHLDHPMITGSEPVVLFRDANIVQGVSFAQLVSEAEPPVPLWEERDTFLKGINSLLSTTAGLAWAADRHTVVLMSDLESEEGAKLTLFFNELPGKSLAGLLSLKVAASSDWIAGAKGDEILEVLAVPVERSQVA